MKLKQILSLGLAAVSTLAMSVSAMAYTAPTDITISVPETDSHSYNAYQIFVGNVGEDGKLNNIKWGQNGTGTPGEGVSAAEFSTLEHCILAEGTTADTRFANDKSELTVIETFVNLSGTPAAEGIDNENPATVKSGYYLIKDKDTPEGEDTYSQYIVKVAGDITISRKATTSTPTIHKTADGVNGIDAKRGDTVKYKIKVTLPDNIKAYKAYKFIVTDTLSAGLAFSSDAQVKYFATAESTGTTYTPTSATKSGQVLTVNSGDITGLDGINSASYFEITYDATVLEAAVLKNDNTASLQYNNNPNTDTMATLNEGPEDIASVYTYTLAITEVDADGAPIEGMELKLQRKADNSDNYEDIATLTTDANGLVTFPDLESGAYKLIETAVPTGYAKHDDINFTINGTINDAGVLTALESNIGSQPDVVSSSADYTTGIITATVGNYLSSSLPVTGTLGIVLLGGAALAACGTAIGMRIKSKKEDDED